MLGKLTPYCVISFLEMCSVLVIMRIIFLVPISGNLLLLLLTTIPFLFTALGMGLLISTLAKNQVQAMQMAYFVILPSILWSGFMFPRGSMPVVMQWVAYFIPATYFIEIMRGYRFAGSGFSAAMAQRPGFSHNGRVHPRCQHLPFSKAAGLTYRLG